MNHLDNEDFPEILSLKISVLTDFQAECASKRVNEEVKSTTNTGQMK
jgi:hypothetical protein